MWADPDNEENLAEAITTLMTDSAVAERLRTAGRARARRFSWEATARRTLDAFDEAVVIESNMERPSAWRTLRRRWARPPQHLW